MSNGNFAGGMVTGYIIGSAVEHESEHARQLIDEYDDLPEEIQNKFLAENEEYQKEKRED